MEGKPNPPAPFSAARGELGIALLAGLLALLLHLPTLRHDLVLDSISYVRENTFLHAPETGALDLWRHEYLHGTPGGFSRGIYRPVTMTTLLLTLRIAGDAAWVHHALNLICAAAATGALALLLVRIGIAGGIAVPAALAFAVHPVHVEAIADVVGRAELLMALFAALALFAHVTAARSTDTASRVGRLAVGVVFGFLAMASKENGVAVVGLVPVVEGLMSAAGKPATWRGRARWIAWGAWLIPLALFLAVRHAALGVWFQSSGQTIISPLSDLPFAQRVALGFNVLAEVWRVSLPVAVLSPDYYFNQITVPVSLVDPRVFLGLFGLALLAGLPLLMPRREGDRSPVIALLGLAWFAVSWLPTSHFVFVAGEPFAERWLYLPILGLLLWAGAMLHRLIPHRMPRSVVVAILIVIMAGASLWHLPGWRDEHTFTLWAARAAPRSTRALYNAGTQMVLEGRYPEALAIFARYFAEAGPGDPFLRGARNNQIVAREAVEEHARTGRWPAPPPPVPFAREMDTRVRER